MQKSSKSIQIDHSWNQTFLPMQPSVNKTFSEKSVMQEGPAHAFPTKGHADIDVGKKTLEVSNKTPFPNPDHFPFFLLMGWRFVCQFALVLFISFGRQIELILIDTTMPHMRKQKEIAQNFNMFAIIGL